MDNKYLKQSYSSIGIKLGGSKKLNKTCKKSRSKKSRSKKSRSKKFHRKYKIIKFSNLLK